MDVLNNSCGEACFIVFISEVQYGRLLVQIYNEVQQDNKYHQSFKYHFYLESPYYRHSLPVTCFVCVLISGKTYVFVRANSHGLTSHYIYVSIESPDSMALFPPSRLILCFYFNAWHYLFLGQIKLSRHLHRHIG